DGGAQHAPGPQMWARAAITRLVGDRVLPQRADMIGLPARAHLLVGLLRGRVLRAHATSCNWRSPYSVSRRQALRGSAAWEPIACAWPSAPRTRLMSACASAGGSSPRQATWPSGRTRTSGFS